MRFLLPAHQLGPASFPGSGAPCDGRFPVGKGRVPVAGQAAAGAVPTANTPRYARPPAFSRPAVSHTLGHTHFAPMLGPLGFREQSVCLFAGELTAPQPPPKLLRNVGCSRAPERRQVAAGRLRLGWPVRARTESQKPPRCRVGSPGTHACQWERSAGVWGPGDGDAIVNERRWWFPSVLWAAFPCGVAGSVQNQPSELLGFHQNY